MSNITPFLWFDNQAEEAVNFYVSIFKNSEVETITRYGDAGPGEPGSVMTASFTLDGQDFIALNGGPEFKFTPAVSFVVNCETQEQVDEIWEKLSEGGQTNSCGWLTDKFGLSWQVVPEGLSELLGSDDAERSQRAMKAMLQMNKLDINELRRAYDYAK